MVAIVIWRQRKYQVCVMRYRWCSGGLGAGFLSLVLLQHSPEMLRGGSVFSSDFLSLFFFYTTKEPHYPESIQKETAETKQQLDASRVGHPNCLTSLCLTLASSTSPAQHTQTNKPLTGTLFLGPRMRQCLYSKRLLGM